MTNRLPTIAIAALLCLALTAGPAVARDYFVDQQQPNASDSNQGTEALPWKTIARAGKAKELKPGDTVLIKSGLYRRNGRNHGQRRAGESHHLHRGLRSAWSSRAPS